MSIQLFAISYKVFDDILKALPSASFNSLYQQNEVMQKGLKLLHLFPQSKRQLEILKDVEGTLEPGRFTLLLG